MPKSCGNCLFKENDRNLLLLGVTLSGIYYLVPVQSSSTAGYLVPRVSVIRISWWKQKAIPCDAGCFLIYLSLPTHIIYSWVYIYVAVCTLHKTRRPVARNKTKKKINAKILAPTLLYFPSSALYWQHTSPNNA